jgi:hypothetical protein
MRFRPGVQFNGKRLGLVVTLLCAAGCAPAPDRTTHSVKDYREDTALRRRELAGCQDDPIAQARKPDCVNAREAERLESIGSLRELPPLQLPARSDKPASSGNSKE